MLSDPEARATTPGKRPRALSLAAAALIAVLTVMAGSCADPASPPGEAPPAAPEPVAPRGAVTLPFVFTWKPVPGLVSPVYRVRVTDAAERVLFESDVRKTECPTSGELRAMLADHATFSWTVAVLADDGSTVAARSVPVQFSLK